MSAVTASEFTNRPRRILGLVLLVIALILIAGGAKLALLGGSIYYLAAGITVAATAWLAFKGDRRYVAVYALFLGATLLWALWEGGPDIWRLQSRLVAPFVLGIWVCWPWLKRYRGIFLGALAVSMVVFGAWLWQSNRIETASAPRKMPRYRLSRGQETQIPRTNGATRRLCSRQISSPPSHNAQRSVAPRNKA